MTMRSRMGSMGGFVTWENFCLKYRNRSCGFAASEGRGVSSPMENTGSLPVTAISLRDASISSIV